MKGVQKMNLKEKQKAEALKRMSILKIMKEVRDDFKNNNKVYYSERQNRIFNAVLYWLDNNEEWEQMVKEFETKHNYLVYHCQLTHFEFGDCLSLLYVSNEESEWEQDKQDLKDGYAFVYAKNLECDYDSDWGTIGIAPSMGGITRTA